MKYFIIMILLCGIFLSFCSKSSSNDPEPVTVEDLLVKDNEISGWTRTGNGWYASNNTELYDAINGAGQIYLDYGFVEGAMQEYQGPVPNQDPSFVSLQIIDLGRPVIMLYIDIVMKI